jgi:hypothetical protein
MEEKTVRLKEMMSQIEVELQKQGSNESGYESLEEGFNLR